MRCLFPLLIFLLSPFAQAKMFKRKIQTIDVERTYRYDERWTKIAATEEGAFDELFKILESSKTGRKIVELSKKRAREYGKSLKELVESGHGSLTDTTLVRKFSPSNPHAIEYKSRSKVIINKNISVKNAILDLAHELTHFALRDPFNPYQGHFGLKDFIVSTVEGRGGEVEAYLVECQVLNEIFKQYRNQSNCHRVVDPHTGRVNKQRGVHEFYQMGEFYGPFKNSLKKHNIHADHFASSGHKDAHFISSAYGLPYPLAAIHEYESIMEKVCLNDSRRLTLMKEKLNRAPASDSSLASAYRALEGSHKQRCEEIL